MRFKQRHVFHGFENFVRLGPRLRIVGQCGRLSWNAREQLRAGFHQREIRIHLNLNPNARVAAVVIA